MRRGPWEGESEEKTWEKGEICFSLCLPCQSCFLPSLLSSTNVPVVVGLTRENQPSLTDSVFGVKTQAASAFSLLTMSLGPNHFVLDLSSSEEKEHEFWCQLHVPIWILVLPALSHVDAEINTSLLDPVVYICEAETIPLGVMTRNSEKGPKHLSPV